MAQGSYRYRTNVPGESDVDICALCKETFFFDLPQGTVASQFSISTPAEYQYPQYKDELTDALISHFGSAAVTRGNKAFDVRENTYRLEADVVPCFEYRLYRVDGSYIEGVAFNTDSGQFIVNWPLQNDVNGIKKNSLTGHQFKAAIRALKCMQYEMVENGLQDSQVLPSYLVQCLLWNVPNEDFNTGKMTGDIRNVLAYLYNNTRSDEQCREWGEVNDIKYLFNTSQGWARQQVNDWTELAWQYIGFE
jgi:hypothetical protein